MTKNCRWDKIKEGIVEKWPGKKLSTTSKPGGICKELKQFSFESRIVKERN